MLVNVDVKALEWVTGTWLSQDKVAYQEIIEGRDQHTDNQEKFKLPSRLIAKIFVFRLIYGGSAYAYANDPDFEIVRGSQQFWQDAIDAFYKKYPGWSQWHAEIYKTVVETGQLTMPTGRKFIYERNARGEWPRTEILNFPVQGTGADLVSIARTIAWRRIKDAGYIALPVSTVHDSIVYDAPEREAKDIGRIILESIQATPKRFSELFDVNFDLPLTGEVEIGYNYKDMQDITKDLYAS
jgi:DNA polymerase I-like protein with 3'-5' exonuclease and polymerase domains